MEEQHSLGWYRARLGNITGSRVGDLMVSSRKKDEVFGGTAMTYIYQIAAERSMNKNIVDNDDAFETYLDCVTVTTKAMQWGTDMEEEARSLFAKLNGLTITETGSVHHPTIPHFASSPDGMIAGETLGCIEIKCPNQNTFMQYTAEIIDAESLKKVKPIYYWQCMSHMMCTGAQYVYFIWYNPFQAKPIHYIKLEPDADAFSQIRERVTLANELIDNLTAK